MKPIKDMHGDLLEENDFVMVHNNRHGTFALERALVQACNSNYPDSDARLCFTDLQIITMNPENGVMFCVEKQWDFHGHKMTKTELKAYREIILIHLGTLELMGI